MAETGMTFDEEEDEEPKEDERRARKARRPRLRRSILKNSNAAKPSLLKPRTSLPMA